MPSAKLVTAQSKQWLRDARPLILPVTTHKNKNMHMSAPDLVHRLLCKVSVSK